MIEKLFNGVMRTAILFIFGILFHNVVNHQGVQDTLIYMLIINVLWEIVPYIQNKSKK